MGGPPTPPAAAGASPGAAPAVGGNPAFLAARQNLVDRAKARGLNPGPNGANLTMGETVVLGI